ncbi:MAG TPA: hypothetical protein PKZ62_02895, partial [Thermoclostridium caenicola]|nr:hypothetical protein [Thermoclostridium caenicola]
SAAIASKAVVLPAGRRPIGLLKVLTMGQGTIGVYTRSRLESPSAFYEKIGYRNASPLRLKIESLPFLLSPGSNEVSFVLNRNETVRFVGSDNQRWCLFQTNDGRFGWLEVYDSRYIGGTGLHASDVFDGLSD